MSTGRRPSGPNDREAAGTQALPVEVQRPITLGQFLKFSGVVGTGGEAKAHIDAGLVWVNGEVETRRGRKLVDGDVVSFGSAARRVSASTTTPPVSADRA